MTARKSDTQVTHLSPERVEHLRADRAEWVQWLDEMEAVPADLQHPGHDRWIETLRGWIAEADSILDGTAEDTEPRFQAITVCTNTSSCYSCEIESRGEYPEIDTHDDIPGIWDRKADILVRLPPGVVTWANQDALVAALEAYMKAAEAMTR